MKNIPLINRFTKNNTVPFKQMYLHEDIEGKHEWSIEDQRKDDPRITFLEERISALEGGKAAFSVKSLRAARKVLFDILLRSGDNIIVYNSENFSKSERAKLLRAGIEIRVLNGMDVCSFITLQNERTKAIYVETIDSETGDVADLKKIGAYAKAFNVPLIVDNTAGVAGYFSKPISYGANIVITSTKRWLHSYRSIVGALIIDAGNYDWTNELFSDNFVFYKSEKNAYTKTKRVEGFSLIHLLRNKSNIDFNKYQIPQNSLQLIKDIENIYSSAKVQAKQANQFALWLSQMPSIKKVIFPGLKHTDNFKKANLFLTNGFGHDILFSFSNEILDSVLVHDMKSTVYKDYINYNAVRHHVTIHIPVQDREAFIECIKEKIYSYTNKKETVYNFFRLDLLSGAF